MGAFGFLGFIFTVATNDFFTPSHTNSFNVYGSLIAHLSLVLTGGLLGLSLMQFSVMPGITRTISSSIIQKFTQNPTSLLS